MTCECCGKAEVFEHYDGLRTSDSTDVLDHVDLCRECAFNVPGVKAADNARKTRAMARVCAACGDPNITEKEWKPHETGEYEVEREIGNGPFRFCPEHAKGAWTWKKLAPLIKARRATSSSMAAADAMTLNWDEIEQVLDSGAAERVLLFGPPGTGKSFAGVTRKAKLKGKEGGDIPVFSITLTPEMSAAEVRGHFVPAGNKFRWMDGPGIAAWRAGGRLVLNEIDQASSDVMTLLHVLLDDPEFARLTLPNEEQEEVRPAAGFTTVATTNALDPRAVLPSALFDRFPVQIQVTQPNPKAIAALPSDLRESAKTMSVHTDPTRRIGLRSWQSYAKLRSVLDENLAGKAVFGPRFKDVINGVKLAGAAK